MQNVHKQLTGVVSYLASELGLAEASLEAYHRDLELLRVFAEGRGKTLRKLVLDDYRAFVRERTVAGDASSTVNRRLASIRAYLRYRETEKGQDTEDIRENLEDVQESQILPEILNEAQVVTLLEAPDVTTSLGLRDRAILELLYATGVRASELCEILLTDIDLKDRSVRVKGKGGKERIVPFHENAKRWVEKYLPMRGDTTSATLFVSSTGRPLERVALWKILQKYAKKAGIQKDCYPHLLRHCFASHMLSGGSDIRVVQELLGHDNIETTQIYTHVDTARLKKVHALLPR